MCVQGRYLLPFLFLISSTAGVSKEYWVDEGKNFTVRCPFGEDVEPYGDGLTWVHEKKEDVHHLSISEKGALVLAPVDRNDTGIYKCRRTNDAGDEWADLKLNVRTVPPPLVDVQVFSSTILAVILWGVSGSGGYPIIYFSAQYRLPEPDNEWLNITPIQIPPNARQIDVYKLEPNTTYAFRVWAYNQLGNSEITVVYATTKFSNEKEELDRMFLNGIKNFDTRVWAVAVGIVMATLVILGFGTCFLLYQECRVPTVHDDQEVIELVPNIILNPGFEDGRLTAPDENSNNETSVHLNNNTVINARSNF